MCWLMPLPRSFDVSGCVTTNISSLRDLIGAFDTASSAAGDIVISNALTTQHFLGKSIG